MNARAMRRVRHALGAAPKSKVAAQKKMNLWGGGSVPAKPKKPAKKAPVQKKTEEVQKKRIVVATRRAVDQAKATEEQKAEQKAAQEAYAKAREGLTITVHKPTQFSQEELEKIRAGEAKASTVLAKKEGRIKVTERPRPVPAVQPTQVSAEMLVEEEPGFPWLWVGVGGVAVIGTAAFIIHRRRKAKKS